MADELQGTLDRGLRARADQLAAVARRTAVPDLSPGRRPALGTDESVAQVLDRRGRVLAASPSARDIRLLGPGELGRARATSLFADRAGEARDDEALRVLAVPVTHTGGTRLAVVAASADDRAEALSSLLLLELLGLGGALLLAGVAGYLAAGVALRPVEAMRARAAVVPEQPGLRLPVPPVDDELGRLGATLNAMLDRIDRAAATERRFLADASHELRTPLAILKGELEVARLEGDDPDALRAAIASAGEEADRLCRLAEDLLVLARADDGHLPLTAAGEPARALLQRGAARPAPGAAAPGRSPRADAAAGVPAGGARLRLEQAVGNLVDNALRHGAGDVRLRGEVRDGAVALVVEDEGPGFPPAFAPRAFERFARADDGRTSEGAGLGLAIVDAVARAHGGTVRIDGPAVSVLLPSSPIPHPPPVTLSP